MKDISQYNAYQGESQNHHRVCGWCPDKEEAEAAITRMEQNRVFIEAMKDNIGYQIKLISHTICEPCKDAVLGQHAALISNN